MGDSTYTTVNVENHGGRAVLVYTEDRDSSWFSSGGCSRIQAGEALTLTQRGDLDAIYIEGDSPGASVALLIEGGKTGEMIVTVGDPIQLEGDKSTGTVSPDRRVNVVNESDDVVHVGTNGGLFVDELTVGPHSSGTIEIFDEVINRLDVNSLAGVRVYFPYGLKRDLEVRVPGQLPIVALPTVASFDDATFEAFFGPGRDAAYEECAGTSSAP